MRARDWIASLGERIRDFLDEVEEALSPQPEPVPVPVRVREPGGSDRRRRAPRGPRN